MSWLFTSSNQSTGASASASVLPMNIQDWFPLGLTGLISLLSKELSRVFWEKHRSLKSSVPWHSTFFMVQLSHLYITAGKTVALTRRTFAGKVKSLVSNMLSRLVIAFLEIEATATMFKRRLSFRGGACCQRWLLPFHTFLFPQVHLVFQSSLTELAKAGVLAPPPQRQSVALALGICIFTTPSVLLPESAPWNTLPRVQTSRWMGLRTGSRCSSPRGRAPVLLSQNQNQERKGCSFQVVFFPFFQICLHVGFFVLSC